MDLTTFIALVVQMVLVQLVLALAFPDALHWADVSVDVSAEGVLDTLQDLVSSVLTSGSHDKQD